MKGENSIADFMEEEQFRHLQKMTALGRLAGGVAHDFNNILQGIFGLCDMVLMGGVDAEEQLQCVQDIRDEAHRGGELTRQLLSFSRNDAEVFSAVDLFQLISVQQKMLQRLLGKQVHLDFSESTPVPLVSAVASQIEQVVMNLCVNARDAMPDGGRVGLVLSEVCFDERTVPDVPGASAGRYVCVCVSDVGTGMSDDVRERLFEPFFTTKERDKGTGLGLAMVFDIVEKHRGWMEVSSVVGQGSVFSLFFPVADSSEGIV